MLDYPCSNLYVEAHGAQIRQTTTSGHPTICFGTHTAAPESLGSAFPINAATAGTTSVTLTTLSNYTNFTVGDPVLIQVNPFVDYNHFILNYVVSINPRTGVLGLLNPLEQTISPNPVIADVASLGWVHNIGWLGGTINSSDDYVFNGLAHDGGVIRDVFINDTETGVNDVFSSSQSYGDEYTNIKLWVPCAGAFDMSSRGNSHIKIDGHSEVKETDIGGCASNQTLSLANTGEGVSHITFDGLHIVDATGQGSITAANTFDTKYTNITALLRPLSPPPPAVPRWTLSRA